MGYRNPGFAYEMYNIRKGSIHNLEKTTEERDFGIIVTNDIKCHSQRSFAFTQGIKALGIISHTFTRPDAKTMMKLYCCFVRSDLKFAVPVWNPTCRFDKNKLERVQRKATKIHDTKGMNYEERWRVFGQQKLEQRRERGDLI